MRYLQHKNTEIEMADEVAEELLVSGALQLSAEGSDLYLNREHNFTIDEVESLLNPMGD